MEKYATLTFYNVNFIDSDNYMFDSDVKTIDGKDYNGLEYYLSKCGHAEVYDNYQYVKDINQLYTTIRIKLEQYALTNYRNFAYNYVKIKNSDMYYSFYFLIIGRRWVSSSCIEFQIKNDVLNNFKFNSAYTLDAFKTRVNREMQTRLTIDSLVDNNVFLKRNLSTIKEGLNPKLYRIESLDKTFNDDISIFKSTFYLIYMTKVTQETADSKIPVDCMLASKQPITLQSYTDGGLVIPINSFLKGEYYYLLNWYSEGSSVLSFNYQYKKAQESGVIPANIPFDMFTLVYLGEDDKIHVKVLNYATPGIGGGSFTGYSFEIDDITSLVAASPNVTGMYKLNTLTTNENEILAGEQIPIERSGDYSPIYIQSIYNNPNFKLDDSRLVKVLEIPYSPLVVNELLLPGLHPHTGKFFYDESTWEYDSATGFLRLKNLNSPLERVIKCNTGIYDDLLIQTTKDKLKGALRDINNESKLFTSEFYYKKASYDSFSFIFELENMKTIPSSALDEIYYKVTTTINSRFMFRFEGYECKYAPEDYSNILVVARNNEVTIYNNNYVNYIRTGYNYDVKARDRSNAQSIASFALSLTPSIAFNKRHGIDISKTAYSAYGQVFSVAQNLTNTINTIEANNDSFNRKQAELQAQSTSVYGSDDLDIMNAYTKGGKMRLYTYRCTDEVRQLIYNLFYFTGYTANRFGLPNLNNRAYFDFFAIDPVYRSYGAVTTDLINEITAKMKEGVTYIHHLMITEHKDFNFNFENWESEIYEKINQ